MTEHKPSTRRPERVTVPMTVPSTPSTRHSPSMSIGSGAKWLPVKRTRGETGIRTTSPAPSV